MLSQVRVSGLAISSCALLLASIPICQAQKSASCKFQLFQLPGTQQNGNQAFAINRYGTVVGEASPNNKPVQGFTRSSNGDVKFLLAPNSTWSMFTGINDNGVSVGNYTANGSNTAEGFMWKGSTFTPIVDPDSGSPYGTRATGINKWNTVVGYYADSSGTYHSYKRTSDGTYTTLDFPGGQFTQAAGINGAGAIAGSFMDAKGEHGFVYRNGQWKKVDYPGTDGFTQLTGISDSGALLGFTTSQEPYAAFLVRTGHSGDRRPRKRRGQPWRMALPPMH